MTKYEYLQQPYKLWLQIQRTENEIHVLKDKATGLKSAADNTVAVSGTRDPHKMENYVGDYCHLEEVLEQKKTDYKRIVDVIQSAINNMDNPTHQIILESRFIDCMSIEDIKNCFHYPSADTVRSAIYRAVDKLPLNVYSV